MGVQLSDLCSLSVILSKSQLPVDKCCLAEFLGDRRGPPAAAFRLPKHKR